MRLKLRQNGKNKHTKLVSSVGWTPSNDLYSASDDHTLQRWSMDGCWDSKLMDTPTDTFVTEMKWLATVRGGNVAAEVFAVACSDGAFRLYNSIGRLEKAEKAHTGAITSLAWSHDGTSLITGGEDGQVKQYSRSGNLRSKLVVADSPILSVAWSPDQSSVLYTTGKFVVIKPLAVSAKIVKWKAHDGAVLKADWNPITNLIVTGGEDRRFKVWDAFGQCLFTSKQLEFPVTSVAWAPSGDYFAVGSFNTISLCDKTGWTHSRSRANSGSIMHLDWSADGTHLAGAGANGAVVFGQLIDRTLEWKNLEIRLDQANHVHVLDILTMDTSATNTANAASPAPSPSHARESSTSAAAAGDDDDSLASTFPPSTEELEFSHRVIEMSLAFDHLVVTTTKQCYVYPITNFSSPHIFDLSGGTVSLILQARKCFLLVDKVRGLQIYSYEGRQISTPRLTGVAASAAALNPMYLKAGNISLSDDILAVIDRTNPTQIHLLDVATGKSLPGVPPIQHEIEVVELAVSLSPLGNVASGNERKVAFIDRNRDLWLCNPSRSTGSTATPPPPPYKLATLVSSARWNESNDMLVALSDQRLVTWYYPTVVYVDKDLVELTKSDGSGGMESSANFGPNGVITSFVDSRVVVRRADGSVQVSNLSPYPALLYKLASENSWSRCERLARYARDEKVLWSMLAVMAIQAHQLDTAEVALAALHLVDKLQFIQSVKLIPSHEGRLAELALYKRQVQVAEDTLLNADLVYRAIKMHIGLFKWTRALELAIKYKTHIDTVCAYRSKFLQSLGNQPETDPQFLSLRETVGKIDWDTINQKIEAEVRKEEQRGTPYRSAMITVREDDPLAGIKQGGGGAGVDAEGVGF